jgi:DNA-binding NtrC family response regulator
LKKKVLIVDDEPAIRDVVREVLHATYDVAEACDAPTGLRTLQDEACDVLITDVKMPGGGHELVQQALRGFPELAVIVISGQSTIEDFIAFLRLGVVDCLLKPFAPAELLRAVARALEMRRLRRENERLKAALPAAAGRLDALVGDSPPMLAVKERITRVAPTDTSVLITGSSGTGKELAARAIHDLSARREGPFVAVNCGALPAHLLESELFGHVRGAFTGADRTRAGRFEEAAGGTLFLDEIGTMPEAVQVRLLRALGTREMSRVGEDRVRRIDVRVVAATNSDLPDLVSSGTFREDLFYRLHVFPIRMPDLAEHMVDVPVLARHLLDDCCDRIGRPRKALSEAALRRLMDHSWPGNVRELQNAIERAVILSGEHATIEAEDVLLTEPSAPRARVLELPEGGVDLRRVLEQIEQDYIRQALDRTGQNRQQAARLLHMERTTLVQKLRRRSTRGETAVNSGSD